MQRWSEVIRDSFGNPWTGATLYVYLPGTTTQVQLYAASDASDVATTHLNQPIVTSSNGRAEFAVNDGDYDLVYTYPDSSTQTKKYVNFFDSSTATTIPVSSISLTAPSQMTVTGSPGTALGLDWNKVPCWTALMGPITGSAKPTFRGLVETDINLIAVDMSNPQTVAGAKTWQSAATFSNTTHIVGATTLDSTLSVAGKATFDAGIDLSKGTTFDIDGTTGYGMIRAHITSATTAAPPSAAVTGALYSYSCANAVTTNLCGNILFPFEYEAGTDFIPFVVWAPNGTHNGAAKFSLDYTGVKGYNQGVLPATTSIAVTPSASAGVTNQVYTTPFAAITGTGYEPGASLLFRFYREGADANDTLNQTVFILAIGMYYKKSRFSIKNTTPPFYT